MAFKPRSQNKYQPKFPRRRGSGPSRLGRFVRLVLLLAVVAFSASFCVGKESDPPILEQPSPQTSPQAPSQATLGGTAERAGHEQKPAGREDINLAGITALPNPTATSQSAAISGEPSVGQAAVPSPAPAQPTVPPVKASDTHAAPLVQASASTALLSREERAKVYGNPWGIPYVGYSLEEIAAILNKHYAPLRPKNFGNSLPGIMNRLPASAKKSAQGKTIALTLAAQNPAQVFDLEILSLLRAENVPVTVFVTSQWVAANKQAFAVLANEPLVTVAAHGKRYKPCSVNGQSFHGVAGTGSMLELLQEVEGNVRDIQRLTGRRPQWFHGATGFYDDISLRIITENLGLFVAGASQYIGPELVATPELFAEAVLNAKEFDIIYCPLSATSGSLHNALSITLARLKTSGTRLVPLVPAL